MSLEAVISAAESAIGVPYQWGGNSLADGVDCSGLVQQAFRAAGIELPRVSASQMRVGQAVGSIEEAQPGDLIGYQTGNRNGSGVEHIAIYAGNGLMIEAYRTGQPVRLTEVRPGGAFRRILGNIDATRPAQVALGPNQDRTITAAALGIPASLGDPNAQVPTVTAAAVTAPPEGGLGDDLPENATEEETQDYIREHFPQYAAWLQNDEIRYVLTWAVREDKGAAEVQGALMRTDYFQTHSATSRSVDTFLGTAGDAEVTRVTDLAKNAVSDVFARNGVQLDDPTLSKLAMQALRDGDITLQGQVMNPAGLDQLVAFGLGQAAGNEGLPAGETSFNADSLMGLARSEYMLPLTRRQAEEWAVQMLNGQQTEESIRAELNRRARDRYSWLGLQDGQTMRSRTDGLVATIADELELDPDTVDLMDARYKGVLEFFDSKAGVYRTMTDGEAAQWARDQDAWIGTRRGRAQGASVTRGLVDLIEGRAA